MANTLARQYFEDVYAAREDPWNYADSPYEKEKYERTLAMLPGHNGNALEIGCSIGVFTALLAPRCDRLLSIDTSERALERARQHCRDIANVQFERLSIPAEYPDGQFDLTVLSEVGYYFSIEDLGVVADKIDAHAAEGGQLLLVHWLPFVPDYPLTGDQVHDFFLQRPGWARRQSATEPKYRIDLLQKTTPPQA